MMVLEALAILEAAVLECKKRHVNTPQVKEALDLLEPHVQPAGMVQQFRSHLDGEREAEWQKEGQQASRVIRSWSSAANSVWVDLPPSIKIGVSLILVQGNEYLSKLSLPAISTLVAGRLHTADSGSPEIFFFLFKCAKCAPGHLIQPQKRRWYYSCGVKPKMRGQAGRVYWVVFDFWTCVNR